MSLLFVRAFAPSQCTLLQLPAPVRQSSVIHASLLARQAAALFHSSPVQAIRKPTKAVLKPTRPQQPPRTTPSSTPRKVQIPFQSHPPSAAPQNIPQPAIASASSSSTTSSPPPQQPAAQPAVVPTPSPTLRQARPDAPQAFQGRIPSYHAAPYQAFVEKLATCDEPTVIYTAQSQTLFVAVCGLAALFVNWVSYITYKNYEPGVLAGQIYLAGAALVNCSVWLALGAYFAWGPVGLLKRIVAVPAVGALRKAPHPRPTLRFEPVAIFGYPRPFEVKMGDVYSDRLFSHELDRLAYWKQQRGPPGVVDEYFGWIQKLWWANLKMFARKFTYVRVYERANFKLDLQECSTLDQGRALDQLIKQDTKPIHLIKRLIRA